MALKTGDTAQLVQPPVQGVVVDVKYDVNTGEKRNLLSWTDASGVEQQRWFGESELALVAAAAPTP